MFHWIRLITVHPALVHFTIGALPLFVVAYVMAAARRSERWTFAGDVVVAIAAAITVGTFVFGLVSNDVAPWPGGLDLWRWLHLGFGAASTALLLALAGWRLARRKARPIAGRGTALAAIGVAAVVAFTGWIGGEVLVYHAGMAVDAAGEGALAPPLTRVCGTPDDLLDAMDCLRASWGDTTATLAAMVVQAPAAHDYERIAGDAADLRKVAAWMTQNGARTLPRANQLVPPGLEENESVERVAGGSPQSMPTNAPASAPAAPETRAEHLAEMSTHFEETAWKLERAARAQDLAGTEQSLGDLSIQCAQCHQHLRWPAPRP